jgi:signal transduction histidine kinase
MTLTLRMRLAAISTIVFGVLLAGLSVVSYEVLGRRLDDDVTERLGELTAGLHGYLRFTADTADPVTIAFDANDDDAAAFVHEATRYYQIYDVRSGQLLVESPGITPLSLHLTHGEVEAFHAAPRPFDIETDYGRLRFSNSVGAMPDGRAYLLQVGLPLQAMDDALSRYRDLLMWRVPIALLVAVAASWWLSKFALLPLTRVAEAAQTIDVRTLERRLPVRGAGDELDRVVEAFNATLGRLEVAVGHMRQFSAAMAHELRTPLAALRGEIDLAWHAPTASPEQRDRFGSQLEEIDRLTRLIDRILTLARAEAGQIKLTRAPVDLTELALRLVEQLEPIAAAKSIELRCEPVSAASTAPASSPGAAPASAAALATAPASAAAPALATASASAAPVVVQGDAGWLERLVLNLVDNAIKFTPEEGRVVIRVGRDGANARIDVEDTGLGLSPEDARRVFERFFRADASRSSSTEGAGLGLSLVQWIAEQHDGGVSVRSRPGAGSTFTVTLPIIKEIKQV